MSLEPAILTQVSYREHECYEERQEPALGVYAENMTVRRQKGSRLYPHLHFRDSRLGL